MISKLLLVGLGGMAGAMGRYLVAESSKRLWPELALPIGTLIVNVVGCFAIGFLATWGSTRLPEGYRLLLLVGLLGGFTTFSAFGLETMLLFENGKRLLGAGNVLSNVLCCLFAVWGGMGLARLVGETP